MSPDVAMTGAEWNDRFVEAFRALLADPAGPTLVSTRAFKAARIAAGMEPADAESPDNEKA
jgi:hypothetical protein